MKRALSLALALIMLFALVACNNNASESSAPVNSEEVEDSPVVEPDYEKKVVVGITADPESWGPWERFNNGRQAIMPTVYQTLTADIIDPDTNQMASYNVMITGWEQLDDTTYEITLREGIVDTNGNAFKASDAVFSFLTCKEKGVLTQLNALADAVVVSDYVFQLKASKAMAVGDMEDLLTALNMVTEASYTASPDGMATMPVGTTGYVMDEYVAGSRVTFVKAEQEYWNKAANESKSEADGYCFVWETEKLDIIQYEIITDTSTLAVALETGQIDVAAGVGNNDMMLFNSNDKFASYTYADNDLVLNYNCSTDSPMQNANLRKAISYAINAADLLEAAYNGNGYLQKAWAYPTFMDWQTKWETEDYYEYNLDTAKEYLNAYLEETGTTAANLKLRLLIMSSPAYTACAQVIQSQVAALTGNELTVEILSFDRSSYNSMYEDKTAFDMFIFGEQNNRTHSAYAWNNAANLNKTGDGTTQFFVNSDELQALVEAAVSPETHSDATVYAFNEYVKENCYVYALISGNINVVAASWIDNIEMGPKNSIAICGLEFDWAAKEIW